MQRITFSQNNRLHHCIPAGLIVPWDSDAAAPTGWTIWTTADGKYIIAAGNTYAVGDVGGSTSITVATDTQGAHTGTLAPTTNHSGSGGVGNYHCGQISAGGHTHNITFTFTPAYRQIRLIKSDTNLMMFPANAIVFGNNSLSSAMTNVYSGDSKYFKANTSRANAAGAISGISVSNAGIHTHANANNVKSSGVDYGQDTADPLGSHNHNVSALTLSTDNIKKAYVSAWTNASQSFSLEKYMIGMYESTASIPIGWALCDGNNGTFDMRDYFVMIGTTVNQGTKSGDNTITVADTIDAYAWTHNHLTNNNVNFADPWCYFKHSNESISHAHDLSNHSPSIVSPYYALGFIQKMV